MGRRTFALLYRARVGRQKSGPCYRGAVAHAGSSRYIASFLPTSRQAVAGISLRVSRLYGMHLSILTSRLFSLSPPRPPPLTPPFPPFDHINQRTSEVNATTPPSNKIITRGKRQGAVSVADERSSLIRTWLGRTAPHNQHHALHVQKTHCRLSGIVLGEVKKPVGTDKIWGESSEHINYGSSS